MRTALTNGYRVALILGVIAIAATGWSIGGLTGAFVWIAGFLVVWGATRFADQFFGGFLLGEAHDDDWDPS